jgi:hypothetical protein
VDMLIEPRSTRHVSLDRVCRSTLCFPPLGPPGEFPSFNGTIKRYDFLLLVSPHFVSFAWRYLGALVVFAPWQTSELPEPGVVNPVLRRDVAEEATGSPKFLGNLNHPFAHVPNRRRQDCLH